MPYTSCYIDAGYGVLKTGSGIVTAAEILSIAREFSLDEANLRKLVFALVDFSKVQEMRVTSHDIRQIVETHRKTAFHTPGVLVAIIAEDPLAFGISRVWHSFSGVLGWKASVFHSRPEAIRWLRDQLSLTANMSIPLDLLPSLQNIPAGPSL